MQRLTRIIECSFLLFALCSIVLGADDECTANNNSTCSTCISAANCVWCADNGRCIKYINSGSIFPDGCSLSSARWLNCVVNFEALLIAVGVILAVLLIALLTCIYCCCCRINKRRLRQQEQREEERANRSSEERAARGAERRAERESRYDEIRRKYGLSHGGSSNAQYSKFDNEADA